jgi:hypothetical protein
MKKRILPVCLLMAWPFISGAQTTSSSGSQQSISGTISMPLLQNVKVEILNNSPLTFETLDEIQDGKIIKSYCRVTVISNAPWTLSVKSNAPFLLNSDPRRPAMSSEMISVKAMSQVSFRPLTADFQEFYENQENQLVTVFEVDVRVKPSLKTTDGNYDANLVFSIKPR